MRVPCTAWAVLDNSVEEQSDLEDVIMKVGKETDVDPRFILAVILQESSGCVRVITTSYSHDNPGLMQSYNGTGSCNNNTATLGLPGVRYEGTVQVPCPRAQILQQVRDGTKGTIWGPGLMQALLRQGGDARGYYITARTHNGGSFDPNDLSQPCCTPSYASDIANRLMGWVHAPRDFPVA